MKQRRLGFVVATAIGGLAVAIAAIPFIQAGRSGDLEGPAIVPRPIVIVILLGLPAGLAAIAAFRESRPTLIGAGVLCLLQSIVGFSGVTLGFVVPGLILVGLGLGHGPTKPSTPTRWRERLAGVLVVVLGIGAWAIPLASSETVCWIARPGPDGTPVYTVIPTTNTMSLDSSDIAGGCDSGAFTMQGLMVGGVLAIGALAMAATSPSRRRPA